MRRTSQLRNVLSVESMTEVFIDFKKVDISNLFSIFALVLLPKR